MVGLYICNRTLHSVHTIGYAFRPESWFTLAIKEVDGNVSYMHTYNFTYLSCRFKNLSCMDLPELLVTLSNVEVDLPKLQVDLRLRMLRIFRYMYLSDLNVYLPEL